jgi:hypothetical protein
MIFNYSHTQWPEIIDDENSYYDAVVMPTLSSDLQNVHDEYCIELLYLRAPTPMDFK